MEFLANTEPVEEEEEEEEETNNIEVDTSISPNMQEEGGDLSLQPLHPARDESGNEQKDCESDEDNSEDIEGATEEDEVEVLLDELEELYSAFGEVSDPLDDACINPNWPPEFQAMLRRGRRWVLLDEYTVGVGIFMTKSGHFMKKVDVFLEESLMDEWYDEHDGANCCCDEYECFAFDGDYDYYFINIDPSDRDYGSTRHVVNNCFDDEVQTKGPFRNFLVSLRDASKDFVAKYEVDGDCAEYSLPRWSAYC